MHSVMPRVVVVVLNPKSGVMIQRFAMGYCCFGWSTECGFLHFLLSTEEGKASRAMQKGALLAEQS